jgi:hypothetical protein
MISQGPIGARGPCPPPLIHVLPREHDAGRGLLRTLTLTPTPTPAPVQGAPAAPSGQRICKVVQGSGTFYLLISSEAEHDFRACAGNAPFNGTLDDLFNLPNNMDRRCIIASDQAIARNHAIVAVYSDTQPADLAAARAYCQQEGGTSTGA